MSADLPRAVLVGELNPHGSDSRYDLYPLPRGASGDRLRVLLGISDAQYLREFARKNLCQKVWSINVARAAVSNLDRAWPDSVPFVLCGRKVAVAFGVSSVGPFDFTRLNGGRKLVLLPHPSGRCREWNAPDARDRARCALGDAGVFDAADAR